MLYRPHALQFPHGQPAHEQIVLKDLLACDEGNCVFGCQMMKIRLGKILMYGMSDPQISYCQRKSERDLTSDGWIQMSPQ